MNKNLQANVFQSGLMAAVVAAALPVPDFVLAQGLAASVTTVQSGIAGIPNIVAGAFYIGGAALIGAGALKLKAHSENPGQTPMGHGLGRLGAGTALIALPAFAAWLNSTFNIGAGTTTFTGLGNISAGGGS